MADDTVVEITRLGHQGDGIADLADRASGPLFVPFALPGETVRVTPTDSARAKLVEVIKESPNRVSPICVHFGRCGGCAVQHINAEAIARWKRDMVAKAFAFCNIDADIAEVVTPKGLRRRAVFTALRSGAHIDIGFHEAQSHRLIDLSMCPVLEETIVAKLPALRGLLALVMPKRSSVQVIATATEIGLDVAVKGIAKALGSDVRGAVANAAQAMDLARLEFDGDQLFQSRTPVLRFGDTAVAVPSGVFVQANADAERELADRVVAAVGKAKLIAELFSGAGAFTFPLARRAKVHAYDSDAAAVAALNNAVRHGKGLKPVMARRRDLFREPLSPLELNEHDAVVFDPPRAGAEAQAKMLARSKLKTIVAISCQPSTLARDARILIDGGYQMETVVPIDQFRYAPHVEMITVFRR